jgi:membrane-bound ClpP family serine protease
MASMPLSDDDLVRKLSAHPDLRKRVESLVLAVEDEAGELQEADAAEMRVIEEMRRMGQEALQAWAVRQVDKTSKQARQTGKPAWQEGKKNCAGTAPSATSR